MKTVRVLTASVSGAFLALSLQASAQDEQITYNSHVAQIINENCVVCHTEGGIGPMQLTNYD